MYCLLLSSCILVGALPNTPAILKNAQEKFSNVGNLETTYDGLVYVKVSDDYIHETLPLLPKSITAPPAYIGIRRVGAHITVITQKESQRRKLFLPQLSQPIVFSVKNFKTAEVGEKRHYYFGVDAPQIELIRLFNGLPPKISSHEFHITIGLESL